MKKPNSTSVTANLPHPVRLAQRRVRVTFAGVLGTVLLCLAAAWVLDFSPSRFWQGLGELGLIPRLMIPPSPSDQLNDYIWALTETLAMALFGTFLAAFLALPLALMGAATVLPLAPFRFLIRRSLDSVRAVDQLIWAIIMVSVVGLGPFAGVLAIMISDAGALGKIFADALENTDKKPIEGLKSTGAGSSVVFRFGLLPQALPVIAGQTLYYFESNCRSAGVLGVVGAGGIGVHLYDAIRLSLWDQVAFLLLMLLGLVALVDALSGMIRKRLH